jgi:hypothetical protein
MRYPNRAAPPRWSIILIRGSSLNRCTFLPSCCCLSAAKSSISSFRPVRSPKPFSSPARLQRAFLGGDSFQVETDQRARTQSGRFVRAFPQGAAPAGHRFRSLNSSVPARWLESLKARSPSSSARWARPAASTTWSPFSAPCRSRLPKRSRASNAMFPGWPSPARSRPFIGLFGTVWGIIDAFPRPRHRRRRNLARRRSRNLRSLITTAAGLAAAIPAVIAYNLIIGSIREMASRNDDFALEMLNLVERQQLSSNAAPVTEARR